MYYTEYSFNAVQFRAWNNINLACLFIFASFGDQVASARHRQMSSQFSTPTPAPPHVRGKNIGRRSD